MNGAPGASRQPDTREPTVVGEAVVVRISRTTRPLLGRSTECRALDGVVETARSGGSAVLVIRGDPGVGKSALLDYAAASASGCRILQADGVESQMELAFAGLHQLCGPLLGTLCQLPAPQAQALGTALGLRAGDQPDQDLIGLATLSILAEAARDQPLVCLVDDAQSLDQASARTLAFVGRRLGGESVALVAATTVGGDDRLWAELPGLTIRGISRAHAAAVLEMAVPGPLDPRVRNRIVDESHGNPLALWEEPRRLTPTELAFGPEPGTASAPTNHIEQRSRRQFETLPEQSQLLLLTAAAEPLGDANLLRGAAARLGVGMEAAVPAEAAGLFTVSDSVQFQHPLVRSVVYRSASMSQRQAVHRALTEVTDPDLDPDRRAWHRAQAASGPDEAVAVELERCSSRAFAHGGLPAAAALLERAALLTPSAADRARRGLDAALAMAEAGNYEAALNLLAVAEHSPLSRLQHARIDMCRAQVGFALHRDSEAPHQLLAAARRLEQLDESLALDSYSDALTATWFTGRLASGADPVHVARAAQNAPVPRSPRACDQLLQAAAIRLIDGYQAAVPEMRAAIRAFDTDEIPREQVVRFGCMAAIIAVDLWDDSAWSRAADRYLGVIRDSGALSALPLALSAQVFVDLAAGKEAAAVALVEELNSATESARVAVTPYAAVALATFRGEDAQAAQFIATARRDAIARGEGIGISLICWAHALLCNGLGRYAEAVAAAREAAANPDEMPLSNWALVELVEAAVRAGDPTTATNAFAQLAAKARASGTEWALGMAARSEAQLREGSQAEDLYREAIERLDRTFLRGESARARLLYGEWLRRTGRRFEAREQLRAADEALTAIGMLTFVGRARRELAATGETVRKRTEDTRHDLTAQELHVARLAADGRTNPEIGAELFISPRTVEWHLGRVFLKLGISARRELRDALERVGPPGQDSAGAVGQLLDQGGA